MIDFFCPTCKAALRAAPEHAGTKIDCPKCNQRIMIPGTSKTIVGLSSPDAAPASAPETPPNQQGADKPLPSWLSDVEGAVKPDKPTESPLYAQVIDDVDKDEEEDWPRDADNNLH